MYDEVIVKLRDFSGYYLSTSGKVYTTIKKGCRDKSDISKQTEFRELSPRPTKTGYLRVYLRRDSTGKREDVYIHRLVAESFIPNPEDLPEVNHIDSDVNNNCIDNLEWISRKDNLKHAVECGNMSRNSLGQFCHK